MTTEIVETNPMRALRIGKVVVNMSVGASGDPLDHAMTIMEQLTQQKPCQRVAKQTIRSWEIRRREPIACMVTLRRDKAEVFLEKALQAVGRKINSKSFDKFGNFAFGIREHIDIPGVKYDPQLGITGMDVLVTVERSGYSIDKKKRGSSKVGHKHLITPEETKKFVSSKLGVKVGSINE
ncbi:50S ribosomal protein L5 [Candidatus Bathyarchaeota archaeon]|nr:50S ribosomal protein L5 [Candidatus Bathyarchaeota archaeon]